MVPVSLKDEEPVEVIKVYKQEKNGEKLKFYKSLE